MMDIATLVPDCFNVDKKELIEKAAKEIAKAYKKRELVLICYRGWKEYSEGKTDVLEHLYIYNDEEIGIWMRPPIKCKFYEPWSHGICIPHLDEIIKDPSLYKKMLDEREMNDTRYMCRGCLDKECKVNPSYLEINNLIKLREALS